MASYNQIGFDILEILKNNQISDDADISMEHILYHIDNQRALWLSNELNKSGRSIDSHLIQDLGCLEIVEVDAAECCSVAIDCIALRTKKKIPPFIELHDRVAITYVGNVNKLSTSFSLVSQAKVPLMMHNKFTSNDIYAVVLNDYIYIVTKNPMLQGIEWINVRGVIANPRDILDFRCDVEGTPCFSYEDEYPINNRMIPYIKDKVLQQFGMSLQMPKDNDGNSKDNISKE